MEVQQDATGVVERQMEKIFDSYFAFVGRSLENIIFGALNKEYVPYNKDENKVTGTLDNSNDTSDNPPSGGEKTLEELVTRNDGNEFKTDSFDISAQNEVLKLFDETAKEHGVDYAIMRGEFGEVNPELPEQVTIIFRKTDTDKMMAVFKDFAEKETERQENRQATETEKGRDERQKKEEPNKSSDSKREKKDEKPKEPQRTSAPTKKKKKEGQTLKEKKAQIQRKRAESEQDNEQKERRKDKSAR